MQNEIRENLKLRIMLCNKKCIDVVHEMQKRGYAVDAPRFSRLVHEYGYRMSDGSKNLRKVAESIVSEWEAEQGRPWRAEQ